MDCLETLTSTSTSVMVMVVMAALRGASIRVGLEAIEVSSIRHDVLALAARTAAEQVRVGWGDETTRRNGDVQLVGDGFLGHDGGEEGCSGEEDELHFLVW